MASVNDLQSLQSEVRVHLSDVKVQIDGIKEAIVKLEAITGTEFTDTKGKVDGFVDKTVQEVQVAKQRLDMLETSVNDTLQNAMVAMATQVNDIGMRMSVLEQRSSAGGGGLGHPQGGSTAKNGKEFVNIKKMEPHPLKSAEEFRRWRDSMEN